MTAEWSWTWGLALAALVSSLVAMETARSLRGGDGETGPLGVAGRYAVLGTATASLLAVFALVWLLPRADPPAGASCTAVPYRKIMVLAYRCTMARWRPDRTIPVSAAARPGTEFGTLITDTGLRQYFVCQLPGGELTLGAGVRTTHWALTLADEPKRWGVVPQVYFQDGGSGAPDGALPRCDGAQKAMIGTGYAAPSPSPAD